MPVKLETSLVMGAILTMRVSQDTTLLILVLVLVLVQVHTVAFESNSGRGPVCFPHHSPTSRQSHNQIRVAETSCTRDMSCMVSAGRVPPQQSSPLK